VPAAAISESIRDGNFGEARTVVVFSDTGGDSKAVSTSAPESAKIGGGVADAVGVGPPRRKLRKKEDPGGLSGAVKLRIRGEGPYDAVSMLVAASQRRSMDTRHGGTGDKAVQGNLGDVGEHDNVFPVAKGAMAKSSAR